MGNRLGREQEVDAARQHGFAERLAGEQIVAEIDGAQIFHARAMRRKPALGGIALAILFFGPVRLDDELGISGTTMLWPGATMVAASIER